jgi:predicted Fe-S protein YdhL (DUF1289 family)
MISTPCLKICQMNIARAYCMGCKRHIDEIAKWSSYSEAERRKVMAELPQRDIGSEDLY